MIDHRYQRQGYGRQAMRLVLEYVRTLPEATEFYTSHLRGNRAAAFCGPPSSPAKQRAAIGPMGVLRPLVVELDGSPGG